MIKPLLFKPYGILSYFYYEIVRQFPETCRVGNAKHFLTAHFLNHLRAGGVFRHHLRLLVVEVDLGECTLVGLSEV